MAARNGFFQILLANNASFVRMYPPQEGGEPIRIDEMRDYLVSKGYNVDVVALNNAAMGITEPTDLQIADKRGIPCAESFSSVISPDKMTVTARFYPFSTAGAALTKEDIISDLNFRGIKKGIDEKAISDFLSNKQYCTDIVIARGLAPTMGEDAKITYYFNTDHNAKPKQNEDGTVDFFDLNIISKCTKGQVLAELQKEVRGTAGYNVVGDVIPPREVKHLKLKFNRNVELSEDGCTIAAKCNGHVSLVDDQVFVNDVYEVVDVDTSTGNIEYNGNVLVTGNIKAGYTVKADGNVEVRGVVEGAIVEATGDVIIARGMNGMGKGVINAGGNVIAKFFENTTVSAGGYIRAEAVLHSKLSAKGDIDVDGKKGFITGGAVRSLGIVSAKTIGTEMGVTTEIEVGVDPGVKIRSNALQQSIMQAQKNIAQMEPVILTFTKRLKAGDKLSVDQIRYFKQISEQYKNLRAQLERDSEEYNSLLDELADTEVESAIKVSQIAYPGTKLTIGDVTMTLSKPVSHTRFVREGADIRIKAL